MSEYKQVKFTEADVINRDDWIPEGEYNPHNVRPWLLHDAGFVLCVTFADCLQDALDNAADEGKLDHFLIGEDERDDYGPDGEGIDYLGNDGKEYDIANVQTIELPHVPLSFCVCFDNRPRPHHPFPAHCEVKGGIDPDMSDAAPGL